MQVVVTGASGLVGTALLKALRARATSVTAVSRRPAGQEQIPGVTWIGWDGLTDAVAGAAGVVHLAGAGIVDKRWSSERKTLLRSSRVERTRQVVEAITESGEKPAVLVSASAIGYYGNETSRECTELAPPGNDFLARLCQDWEAATEAAGVRTVKLRFGIVLSSEGGALAKLLLPFRFGLGGPIGRGRNYWSWVHIDDAVGVILHALSTNSVSGALNVTAPKPARNAEFSRILGAVLQRPALLPLPPLALQLLLGEGSTVLTASQRVLPTRTLESGYAFEHPELEPALRGLVG